MAEHDRVSGNKRSFSDEGDAGGKRPTTGTAQVLVLDHNGDDVSFQGDNFEIVEGLRRRGKETASSAHRQKIPVRRPRMRLLPARKTAPFVEEPRVDVVGEEELAALFENFDWRRIGWEDIDKEEDRRFWRAAAKKLCWKYKNRKMDQGLKPVDRPKEADCS